MTARPGSWQAIEAEVLRRIHARDWPPGSAIPNEADLAQSFGVARATVNRALQSLAEAGILDRRRKAGTRVALHPVRRATLRIPILRHEVEAAGQPYACRLLARDEAPAPEVVTQALRLPSDAPLLHLRALHLAGGAPHALEERWVNAAAVPAILSAPLDTISANEWLVANAPFTSGDFSIAAANATTDEAAALACQPGAALVEVLRTTWDGARPITWVRLLHAPGYRMRMAL
ncbi:MAG: UTRA domain-containing protein [Rhodobacterales bacterium]|nr:UTRA domain-containing protein [Rhodobacterales bacterium]NCT13143.1 UTRA domain-containing protein [Rhodobacterales bacterium]